MQAGRIVEVADRETLYASARHPYSRSLLAAVPIPDPPKERQRIMAHGTSADADAVVGT
jgi:ABC-type oligopeptide transport system ATPase subunit